MDSVEMVNKIFLLFCWQVLFHYKTLNEPATIHRLCSVLHKSTGEVLQKKPR